MKNIFNFILAFVFIFTGCTVPSTSVNNSKSNYINNDKLKFNTKSSGNEVRLSVSGSATIKGSISYTVYAALHPPEPLPYSYDDNLSGYASLSIGNNGTFSIIYGPLSLNGTIPNSNKTRGNITGILNTPEDRCQTSIPPSTIYVADNPHANAYPSETLLITSGNVNFSIEGDDIVANVSSLKSAGRYLSALNCESVGPYGNRTFDNASFTLRLKNVATPIDKINVSLLPHAFSGSGGGASCPASDPDDEDANKDIEVDPTNDDRTWVLKALEQTLATGKGKKKVALGTGFSIASVRNISAGDIKAYYENDTEETFSPPAVDDNDGELEPDDLDLFIQKLEAITALDLIKNSGFKTKSISPSKELRKTQLLAQMESDERVRLFSDLDTLDSQLTTFTNEIDKLSQTRYFIGRPKGITSTPLTPTELFNQYKLKIDELKSEFDYLVESENTYSLVDAGANLAKQIQMYMFLIRDYADTKVADEVTNSQELTQFQDESDYFDKVQDTTTLIRFLQKNISDSKNKIVSENDKLKQEIVKTDLIINKSQNLLNKIDTEKTEINNYISLLEQKISELEGNNFNTQSLKEKKLFSIKGEAENLERQIAIFDDEYEKLTNDRIDLTNGLVSLVNSATGLDLPLLRTRLDRLKDILEQQEQIKQTIQLLKQNAETRKKNKESKSCSDDQNIKWIKYPKHIPPKNKTWNEIKDSTKNGQPAKYHPDVNIQKLETEGWKTGTKVKTDGGRDWKVKEYDTVIGANSGKDSKWQRIEKNPSGEVHGHPITYESYQNLISR